MLRAYISLLYLMHKITCAHASTEATNWKCVKNSTSHFCLMTLSRALKEKNIEEKKEETKTSNLIVDHFPLTLLTFSSV